MVSAQDVAKYFLYLANANEDDSMSNMKLQKLLYYAQGFHLAIFDKALFPEAVDKWTHGPVVPSIYHEYKKHGNKPIPFQGGLDLSVFSTEEKGLLDEVFAVVGQYSAFALRNATHREPPWLNAEDNKTITKAAMKTYFKTRLVNDDEKEEET